MSAPLESILDEARAGLSAAEPVELANHTGPLDFTNAEITELKRRHHEPFDPAPEADVRELFARHRR